MDNSTEVCLNLNEYDVTNTTDQQYTEAERIIISIATALFCIIALVSRLIVKI